jgi:hypothetical protein
MTSRTLTATAAYLGIAAMSVVAAVASTAAESRLGLTQAAIAGALAWLH